MNAYIFDLDGTLFDTSDIWAQLDLDFLAERGLPALPEYLEAISSMSFQESAQYTIDFFSLPDRVSDLLQEWNCMAIQSYEHGVTLKEGAFEFIRSLKNRSVKTAIATSLSEALYGPALKHLGLESYFDVICSTFDVEHGKSRPDIFYLVAQKLAVNPSDCIVLEDELHAIKSAKEAGMKTYAIYDEASEKHWGEICNTADIVFYHFKDIPLP